MCGSELKTAGRPFAHVRRQRWQCDVCKRMELLDEIRMYVATVYDRGHFIVRACRACRGKMERNQWRQKGSLKRLEQRIAAKGCGDGPELILTLKRLGLGSGAHESGRGTPCGG